MTTEEKKKILIEYQQMELNSRYEQTLESPVDILSRLMVFSMPNSTRTKLVYLSNHQSYSVDIEQLLSAIEKENLLFVKQNWTGVLEYYTINPMTRDERQFYAQMAMRKGVTLVLYDYGIIAQHQQLNSLIDNKSEYEYQGIDPIKKGVYEILAYGAASTDIKQRIAESYILHTLFMGVNESVLKEELIATISEKNNIQSQELESAISSLLTQRLIAKDPLNKKCIQLTPKGRQTVQEACAKSQEDEATFKNILRHICEKYNINESIDVVIGKLKELAVGTHFELLKSKDPSGDKEKDFCDFLLNIGASDINACLKEVQVLCKNNPFIARLCVGEIFITQVGSKELEHYTRNIKKCIYLDTPVITYWICSLAYNIKKEEDWENSQYQATRNLMDMILQYPDEIDLGIEMKYLGEVAGEIQKALRLQILENAHFKIPFKTNNTFYKYYQFIKEKKELGSFSEFLRSISLSDNNVDNIHYTDRTAVNLRRNINQIFGREIVENDYVPDEEVENIVKKLPLDYLYKRNVGPLHNDVRQACCIKRMYDREVQDSSCHYFLATWDPIFDSIRQIIQKNDPQFLFYASSPTQLASQLAMAHFSLSSDILTDAMFITADTTDAIIRLYDNALSLLVEPSNEPSLSALQRLIDAQLEFMQTYPIAEEKLEEDGYPLENVIDSICSQVIEWGLSMTYLRKYLSDETQFEQIRADLDTGYTEIFNQKDYLKGEAIKIFKEHLEIWAKNHQEVDTLDEEGEDSLESPIGNDSINR